MYNVKKKTCLGIFKKTKEQSNGNETGLQEGGVLKKIFFNYIHYAMHRSHFTFFHFYLLTYVSGIYVAV